MKNAQEMKAAPILQARRMQKETGYTTRLSPFLMLEAGHFDPFLSSPIDIDHVEGPPHIFRFFF